MKIKRLYLHNFGIYADDNEFVFQGEKPIVLIGGKNGRGKTTFLEAVLLALYGPNSFAYNESGYKSYNQYLRSFVNNRAEDQTCIIELEFEIDNGIKENYVIRRKWDSLSKRTKEEIRIDKDGVYNPFLTENWSMFIENILPSALSSFFFFDGEKIAELAVEKTNDQLKKSIRSMLGITVLDVLEKDLNRNLNRLHKEDSGKTGEEVESLRIAKENAENGLHDIELQIEKMREEIYSDQNFLEALNQDYIRKGGLASEQRETILQKRGELSGDFANVKDNIYELVASELPFMLVRDLIMDIKLSATDEHDDFVMQQAIGQMDQIFEEFSYGYGGEIGGVRDFIDYLKIRNGEGNLELLYSLSDQALYQVNSLVESDLDRSGREIQDLLRESDELESAIGELDSYLNLDINELEVSDIQSEIKEVEKRLIEKEIRLSDLEKKRKEYEVHVKSATSAFNHYVEAYLSSLEMKDETDRKIKYSTLALKILRKYQIELQKKKTDLLGATITQCYHRLTNKVNMINRIVVDPESLDFSFQSEDRNEISGKSFSAGEQQLIVISILWALAICSKKKPPVIIDTPLSRLDSMHRYLMITTYFPNASEQTIILSTDSEIGRDDYERMKNDIGDEFRLIYSDESKSTSILKGYLSGE